MIETALYKQTGEEVGKVALPEAIFSQKASRALLHEVVQAYRNNLRRGTHSTKTRSEVSGGGHKPWKQKHTGRARAGSNRSPLWRGGGIIFGPRPGRVRHEVPSDKKRQALTQALSEVMRGNRLRIVEGISIPEQKTRLVTQILKSLKGEGNVLLVLDTETSAAIKRATKNIAQCEISSPTELNTYHVLWADVMIMTQSALNALNLRVCKEIT